MSEPREMAIECCGLSKAYRLGEELTLRRSLSRLTPGRSAPRGGFWALDDVTFSVPRGDFFGIVGSNGSGKSTLTQVISGITVPTRGEARVWGRILPLLEVGAGFHEELTGRENIFLLGTIIGLARRHIAESVDRIAHFAGVGQHLDTALKRYSSGMRARLSFATAICFPADTYVFDEVLAVVDAEFRQTCMDELGRLNELGRTIVFMSHDLDLVVDTCRTGMWLEKGRVRMVGAMDAVGAAYAAGHVDPAPVAG